MNKLANIWSSHRLFNWLSCAAELSLYFYLSTRGDFANWCRPCEWQTVVCRINLNCEYTYWPVINHAATCTVLCDNFSRLLVPDFDEEKKCSTHAVYVLMVHCYSYSINEFTTSYITEAINNLPKCLGKIAIQFVLNYWHKMHKNVKLLTAIL